MNKRVMFGLVLTSVLIVSIGFVSAGFLGSWFESIFDGGISGDAVSEEVLFQDSLTSDSVLRDGEVYNMDLSFGNNGMSYSSNGDGIVVTKKDFSVPYRVSWTLSEVKKSYHSFVVGASDGAYNEGTILIVMSVNNGGFNVYSFDSGWQRENSFVSNNVIEDGDTFEVDVNSRTLIVRKNGVEVAKITPQNGIKTGGFGFRDYKGNEASVIKNLKISRTLSPAPTTQTVLTTTTKTDLITEESFEDDFGYELKNGAKISGLLRFPPLWNREKVLILDGVDDYAKLNSNIDFTQPYTIFMRFYLDGWENRDRTKYESQTLIQQRCLGCSDGSRGAMIVGIPSLDNWNTVGIEGDKYVGVGDRIAFMSGRDSSNKDQWTFGTTEIIPGFWYDVALVNDGTTSSVYVNGNLESSENVGRGVSGFNSELVLGGVPSGVNTGWKNFNGSIDEVMIYQRALSDLEIRRLSPKGIAGESDFERSTDDYTLGNGAKVIERGGNKILDLDGIDDYVLFSEFIGGEVFNDSYSVSVWINLRDWNRRTGTEGQSIVQLRCVNCPSGAKGSMILGIPSLDNWNDFGYFGEKYSDVGKKIAWMYGVDGSDNQLWVFSDTEISNDRWYNVIVTYDAFSETAKIYVNGVLENQDKGEIVNRGYNYPLVVGGPHPDFEFYERRAPLSDTIWKHFNGYMDGIEFYDTVLSEREINDIYSSKDFLRTELGMDVCSNGKIYSSPNPVVGQACCWNGVEYASNEFLPEEEQVVDSISWQSANSRFICYDGQIFLHSGEDVGGLFNVVDACEIKGSYFAYPNYGGEEWRGGWGVGTGKGVQCGENSFCNEGECIDLGNKACLPNSHRCNSDGDYERCGYEGEGWRVVQDCGSEYICNPNLGCVSKSCGDQGGNLCSQGEYCPGEQLSTSEGINCCSTECIPVSEEERECSQCGEGLFNLFCDRKECGEISQECIYEGTIRIFGSCVEN